MRSVLKMTTTLLLLIATATSLNAQVVFKGPTEAKPNKMVQIVLEEVKGNDLKLQVFLNGKITSEDWLLMKNLDNQNVIFLLTDKEAVFTFVAATNLENKTFLTNHVLTVGVPKPIPPSPVDPVNSTFSDKLKASYKASPDPAKLTKLISIFEQVTIGKYKNYDEMETVLSTTAKKFLADTDLRTSRDVISAYFLEKLGDDPRRVDTDKGKALYTEVLTILKSL